MDKYREIPILIQYLDRKTNFKKEINDKLLLSDMDNFAGDPLYYWEGGNFSCDCNRLISMYGDDGRYECGDSRVAIESIRLLDGTVLYREWIDASGQQRSWCSGHDKNSPIDWEKLWESGGRNDS